MFDIPVFPQIQNNLIHKDTATAPVAIQILRFLRLWEGSMIIELSGGKVEKPVLNASP